MSTNETPRPISRAEARRQGIAAAIAAATTDDMTLDEWFNAAWSASREYDEAN